MCHALTLVNSVETTEPLDCTIENTESCASVGVGIVESFVEPGFEDNCEEDPYEMSSPQIILEYLKENKKVAV